MVSTRSSGGLALYGRRLPVRRALRVVVGVSEGVARDDARHDAQALKAHPLLLVAQCSLRFHACFLRACCPSRSLLRSQNARAVDSNEGDGGLRVNPSGGLHP